MSNKELVKFNESGQWEILEKADDYNPAARQQVNSIPGWSLNQSSKVPGVHFHHPDHDIVSITKNPQGEFEVKHRGALAGVKGQKGVFSDPTAAGAHAREYMNSLIAGTNPGNIMRNFSSSDKPETINPMNVVKGDEHMDLQCSEEEDKEDAKDR